MNALLAAAPPGSNKIYYCRETLSRIAEVWITHCVNQLHRFPRRYPCARMDDYFYLSKGTLTDYLDNVMMDLAKVGSKRLREPEVTATEREAQHVAFFGPSSTKSLNKSVISALLNDASISDKDLVDFVNGELSSPVNSLEILKRKIEIMKLTEIPFWLHDVLWSFRHDCRADNAEMIDYAKAQGPRTFPIRSLEAIVPVWKQYCVDALVEYFAVEEGDPLPLPCAMDRAMKNVKLEPIALRKYLTNLLEKSE